MARGWGKSEEDLGAEKEQARQECQAGGGPRKDRTLLARRRTIELSLARIDEQLAATANPVRRSALESARRELAEQLARL